MGMRWVWFWTMMRHREVCAAGVVTFVGGADAAVCL